MNLEFRITRRQSTVVFLILYSLFCIPVIAHAQGFQIIPQCNPVPARACFDACMSTCNGSSACTSQCTNQCGGPGAGALPTCGVEQLFQLLVNIYNFLLGLAGLVAMLFIIWGGLRMLYFSYLEDSASELSAAKLTVRRAVGGFIIIALGYLIVNTALTLLGLDTAGPIGTLLKTWGLI